jgi:hypothetical protein
MQNGPRQLAPLHQSERPPGVTVGLGPWCPGQVHIFARIDLATGNLNHLQCPLNCSAGRRAATATGDSSTLTDAARDATQHL